MILMTGGTGFLGQALLPLLLENKQSVRVLVLQQDPQAAHLPEGVEVCYGNLLNDADLDRFFTVPENEPVSLIHCASFITMSIKPVEKVHQVNVEGTRRLIERCLKKGVQQMIYVSSVHAIMEAPFGQTMKEPGSTHPDSVHGYYAKTKAEATALVMRARQEQGLPASIVYPAGMAGPGDFSVGNLTQMFMDYFAGKIPIGVQGGYNFCDVRDVAQAIFTLFDQRIIGKDYVLAGEYIKVGEILDLIHKYVQVPKIKGKVPLWLARLALPFLSLRNKLLGLKPVFSSYSLYTLGINSSFDSSKATRDLGYQPRPIQDTIRDTARWLAAQGHVKLRETAL